MTTCGRGSTASRRGGCPKPSTSASSRSSTQGLRGFLAEVVDDPKHELRDHLDERLRAFAHDLQHDPELPARGEELKREMLAHPALREWTASMWADAKAALAEQAVDPESTLRLRLASAAASLGERLTERSRPPGQGRRRLGPLRRLRARRVRRHAVRDDRVDRGEMGRRSRDRSAGAAARDATCSSSASTAPWSAASSACCYTPPGK